jgi:hypothetical protein
MMGSIGVDGYQLVNLIRNGVRGVYSGVGPQLIAEESLFVVRDLAFSVPRLTGWMYTDHYYRLDEATLTEERTQAMMLVRLGANTAGLLCHIAGTFSDTSLNSSSTQ